MPGRLCLTGVVRLEDGAGERVLHGTQPRLLLVRVAMEAEHPVTADSLALLLWPAGGHRSDGALRGVVAKIRSFLGPEAAIDNIGRCYRFRPVRCTVDVTEADDLLAVAEAATADGRWADAATAADAAVGLLADPLLPGVDAAWLLPRRARLERHCARARRVSALSHSALGHHDQARDLAESAVDADPFDEPSHRILMAVLLAGGNRSEALLAYERLRRLLADELGIGPDAETRSVYEQAVLEPGDPAHGG